MSSLLPIKVVLDTNIFISFLLTGRGPIAKIYSLWQDNAVQLYYSDKTLAELTRSLDYPKFQKLISLKSKRDLIYRLQVSGVYQEVVINEVFCRDNNDDCLINLAIACEADYIVTGDKDLLELKQSFAFAIINPSCFIDIVT